MSENVVHYGVKGMKWGVRKQRKTSSGKRKVKTNAQRIYERITKKKEPINKSKTSTSSRKKRASEMSDEELRSVINRMQMERTYAQLTTNEINKGRKFVNDVLYNSAKATATTYTTKAMTKAVDKLLRNASSGGSS